MKIFEEPELELVRFTAADLIATSPFPGDTGSEEEGTDEGPGDLDDLDLDPRGSDPISAAYRNMPGGSNFGQ